MIEAFVDIETGDVVARSVDDLRKRVADRVTLPVKPSREDLEALGFQGVRIGRAPDYNPDTHDVRLSTVYDVRKKRWMPAWSVYEREDADERLADAREKLAQRAISRAWEILGARFPIGQRLATIEKWIALTGRTLSPEGQEEFERAEAAFRFSLLLNDTADTIAAECRRGEYDDKGDPASDPRFDRFTNPEGR